MKQLIIELLEKELKGKIKKEEFEHLLEIPPSSELGDFAFPCFALAKIEKKSPLLIAEQLAEKFRKDLTKKSEISNVDAKAGYVNFFLNKKDLTEDVLSRILKEGENYGKGNEGKGKLAFIEHTSINPNASPHMGRSRNALIGDFIVRLLRFRGFKSETHYFVNDVGKQIAMLVLGAEGKKNVKFSDLLDLYVKINQKVKDKPELENNVFELLNKFESGDKSVKQKFHDIVKICIDGQSKILGELGIKYDSFDYESKYLLGDSIEKILGRLEKIGKIFKDEEGRTILNQEGYDIPTKSPVLVLTRADGTSLYPLRDIAYTIDKMEKSPTNNFLVLGEDQKTYFKQISAAMDILGYGFPRLISYSFVLLTDGKMSTRQGNVVLLEDFFKDATNAALKGLELRGGKADIKKAKLIAMSAVKYSILKIDSQKNVIFDLASALEFDGNTGPYLLYSYARANSIIKKTKRKTKEEKIIDLKEQEIKLIKLLGDFPSVVKKAYNDLAPNLIANYVYDLSQSFNEFYHSCPVIGSEEEAMRLKLVEAFKIVMKSGLNLLGIEEIDEM